MINVLIDNEWRAGRVHLEDAVEDIRRRFGKRAISYAVLMVDLKMPVDGRHSVRMQGPMYQ